MDGIDVSHWNGVIDWKGVKAAGVKFAFIKSSEGNSFIDNKFSFNFEEAWRAKLHIAPYHFVKPLIPLKEQVAHFVKQFRRKADELLLSPVIDIEWDFDASRRDRWLRLSSTNRLSFVINLIKELEDKTGRKPIIYTAASFWNATVKSDPFPFSTYPLWVADYGRQTTPRLPRDWATTKWTMWQFSDKGKIRGIQGNVDLNFYRPESGHFTKLLGAI